MNKIKISANILFCATFFFWFSQYAYSPYINPELKLMGASAVFMGFVSGAYGFVQLLLRLPLGITADRLQKQKLFICAGSFCAMVSSLGMYLFYHPVSFLIFRGLSGIAASTWVSFTVLYSSYFANEKSSKAITILGVSNQFGRLCSFILGSMIVSRLEARYIFALSALAGGIAFLFSLFITDVKIDRKPADLSQLATIVKDRNLITTSILAILVQLVYFATVYSFSSNFAISIGAEQAQLGIMNIVMLVPYTLANLLAGVYLMERIPIKRLLITGFAAMALYCGLLPSVGSIPMLYVMQAVVGIGGGLTLPVLMGSCVRDIEPHKKATAMGFFQAVYGIGMTLGPIFMGMLTDFAGLHTGFYVTAGIAVLAVFLTHRFYATQPL